MGHSIITCKSCGTPIMEGRSGSWHCECGWQMDTRLKLNADYNTEQVVEHYDETEQPRGRAASEMECKRCGQDMSNDVNRCINLSCKKEEEIDRLRDASEEIAYMRPYHDSDDNIYAMREVARNALKNAP